MEKGFTVSLYGDAVHVKLSFGDGCSEHEGLASEVAMSMGTCTGMSTFDALSLPTCFAFFAPYNLLHRLIKQARGGCMAAA
jgi:hypothetical protein